MAKRLLTFLLLYSAVTLGLCAQRRSATMLSSATAHASLNDSIVTVADSYAHKMDSLSTAIRYGTALTVSSQGGHLTNPYYYPLFAANSLLQHPISYTIGSLCQPVPGSTSILPHSLPAISWTLIDTYARHPETVRFNLTNPLVFINTKITEDQTDTSDSRSNTETLQEASQAANAPVQISKEDHTTEDILDLSDFHIQIRRPNFWKVRGSFSTQFMQYYVSSNWYKGGDNHLSMLGNFNIEANYDNKQKVTFSNKLEAKLGFQTSPNDEFHKFKTNTDLVRMTNKLGIKAHKHWYYSGMLQTWTQFYKAYKSNSADISSNFMSPFESVFSIGMDYKLEKKRVNLNVNIAPGALDYKYCSDKTLLGSHIKDGEHPDRHYKMDLGSTLTANMTLKLCNQVNWVSRFYTFYNYKTDANKKHDQIKWEWENTINLKVNKYLSSKIFLYPRYEGGLKKNRTNPETGEKIGNRNKIQFNEYISVGFDINF